MEAFIIPDSLTSLEEDDQYKLFISDSFEFFNIDPSDPIDFLDEGSFFSLMCICVFCLVYSITYSFFADTIRIYDMYLGNKPIVYTL